MRQLLKIIPLTTLFLLSGFAWGQESHTVQSNQTLYSIAKLYNVSIDQLKAWNGLGDGAIRVGQSLVVKPAARNATVNPGLNSFLYTVRAGDTLNALAVKFDTPADTLVRINGLSGTQGLELGQRLYIRRPVGISFYTVQTGDTLGHVSALFNLAQADLRAINQLSGDTLPTGLVLRVFKPAEVPLNHTVAAIDTPAGVAALYGLSVAELQRLNGAEAMSFKQGQVLKLRSYASANQNVFQAPAKEQAIAAKAAPSPVAPIAFPEAPAGYVVEKGDTLLKIARKFNLRLDDLLSWNDLSVDSVLRVGQALAVASAGVPAPVSVPVSLVEAPIAASKPLLPRPSAAVSFPAEPAGDLPAFRDADQAKIRWDSYVVLDKAIPVFEWNNDYYYWTHPGELSQPNRGYYENSWASPLDAYQKARQLASKFDALIDQKGPLSTILKGWTVVIDPGHGGLDPGAIVKAKDELGKDVYLTEHEYVYDISLRVYALLKRHGANVKLTILAPSHLVRDTQPTNNTLVNEKNQVYNDLGFNQGDDSDAWPNGTQKGLDRRIAIAEKAFANTAVGKRVFLSLHADNNPLSPLGTGVFALETREGSVDQKSLDFAKRMLPYLGGDAYARTQNLAVLRGNEADYKLLVEVHNLASEEQSQAMRAGSSRQLSAQKIVRGILEAFWKGVP